jgi:hypothetical protein
MSNDVEVASISDDNQRNIEPWTGKWKVVSSPRSGIYAMKQNGQKVVLDLPFLYDKSCICQDHDLTSSQKIRYGACINLVYAIIA